MASDQPQPPSAEMAALIPEPMAVRRLIGLRAAELSVLRKLLRVVESRDCLRTRSAPPSSHDSEKEVANAR